MSAILSEQTTTVWLVLTSLGQVSLLRTIFCPSIILSHKEYLWLPNHYNKYHSRKLLSEKEQLPLLPLNKKLTDSSLKEKKPSLYQRLKKGQTSTRAFRLLPK